jgi:hypothetical protein
MRTYLVTWDINIEAESPREAAERALAIQRKEDSTALTFTVWDDKMTVIDLNEPES